MLEDNIKEVRADCFQNELSFSHNRKESKIIEFNGLKDKEAVCYILVSLCHWTPYRIKEVVKELSNLQETTIYRIASRSTKKRKKLPKFPA